MTNETENTSFSYTYSATEQDELRALREKYMPKTEGQADDKMETVRRLDKGVTRAGNVASLITGIVGTLIMGTGMSLAMEGATELMPLGIIIGLFGMLVVAMAYPVYALVIKKERKRVAPEILRLTEELLK